MSQLLIKSVTELKVYVPFAHTETGWHKVSSIIFNTQEKYIKSQLDDAMYDELLNYADPIETSGSASASGSGSTSSAGTSTAAWLQKLLEQACRSLAWLSLYEGFGIIELQFGSDGVHRIEGSELKTIYSGQREAGMRTLQKTGMDRLEAMVLFLEKNADEFPAWKTSECYTIHKKRVVRSAEDFSKIYTPLNRSRLTYSALLSFMQEVEEDALLEVLGDELHEEWFTKRAADNLSTENEKLLKYMQRIVVYQTIAEALPDLSLQIEAYGVFTPLLSGNEKNTQELAKADNKRFVEVRKRYSEKADRWKNKLKDFLNKNNADYPLFPYNEEKTKNTGTLDNQEDNGIVGF